MNKRFWGSMVFCLVSFLLLGLVMGVQGCASHAVDATIFDRAVESLMDDAVAHAGLIAVVVIGGLISWVLAEVAWMIRGRARNERIDNAIRRVCAMAETVVAELGQTTVEEFRKKSGNGGLSRLDGIKLQMRAVRLVKERLAPGVLKAARAGFSSLDKFISARIERAVGELKREEYRWGVVTSVELPGEDTPEACDGASGQA